MAHRNLGALLLPPLRTLQARHLELVHVRGEEPVHVHTAVPGAGPPVQGATAPRTLRLPRFLRRPQSPHLRLPCSREGASKQ